MLMLIDFLPPCKAFEADVTWMALWEMFFKSYLFYQWTETKWKRHGFFVGFRWWWGAASWPETFHLMGCCFPIRTRKELQELYGDQRLKVWYFSVMFSLSTLMAHVQETQLQFWVANLVVTYDVVMLCARQSMHSMPTSLTRQGPPHSVRTSLWANYAVSRIGWNSDQIW